MRQPRRAVWIAPRYGPDREVDAVQVLGVWAITPHQDDPGRYNVTHVPSGLGMFSGFNCGLTLRQARKAMQACAALPGDWSQPVDSAKDLTPEQRKAGKALQQQFLAEARQ